MISDTVTLMVELKRTINILTVFNTMLIASHDRRYLAYGSVSPDDDDTCK